MTCGDLLLGGEPHVKNSNPSEWIPLVHSHISYDVGELEANNFLGISFEMLHAHAFCMVAFYRFSMLGLGFNVS